MGQSWDTMWTSDEEVPVDPKNLYQIIYPVFMRKQLKNSEVKYSESLIYVASKLELAKEWCARNTNTSEHDKDKAWWFAITNEAVDGEYIGVGGLVELLDWDAKELDYEPIDGYEKEAVK